MNTPIFPNLSTLKLQFNSYHEIFDYLANILLNKVILKVHNTSIRITEIEFYLHDSTNHPDPFVHCHNDQKTYLSFYFHKFGDSFKSGTFKGVDITFGDNDVYAGILLRSIYDTINDVNIEGSCNVVNYILKLSNLDSIGKLIENQPLNSSSLLSVQKIDESQRIYCLNEEISLFHIFQGPRVGLTYKNDIDENLKYITQNYRYCTNINKIKKMNHCLIMTSMIKFGDKLSNIANINEKLFNKIKKFYNEHKDDKNISVLDNFVKKKLNNTDMMLLYLNINNLLKPKVVNINKN